MRWLPRLAAGLVLAFSLTLPVLAASPDGQSPTTAFPLSGTASGSLTGSTGGSFVYYTFGYPGDGSLATLTLAFSPGDLATANGIGVDLWQGGSRLRSINGVSDRPGINSTTFATTTPGPILVQVYSYIPSYAISYQLTLSGLSPTVAPPQVSTSATPTPPTAASAIAADGSASNPFPLTTPAGGLLPSNQYGSYVYYTGNYPGDGSRQSVTLDFSPRGNDVGNAVFLTVYQDGVQLAQGQGSQSPTLGQIVVSFASTTPGPILIEIGNYNMSATISYTISYAGSSR